MKNFIFKTFLIFFLSLITVVSLGADFVTVYFHDGTHKRFYLNEVKEIRNSKYDLDKNLHADYRTQMIETKDGTYLQDISKIDSVVFSKEDVHFPKTEEEIEAMIERSHEIAVRMNQIVDSLKAIGAYDPMIITQEFSKIPDVIDAELDESNSCITLIRSDSIYHDFILDYWSIFSSLKQRNHKLSSYNQASHASYKYYPHINQTHKTSEHFIGENKLVKEIKEVLILAPFLDLYSNYSDTYFEELCELIRKNLGVAPRLFKGDLADITKFKGTFLDNFDLILFYTHGGRSNVGTRLLSGTSMSKNKDYWKKAVEEGVIPEIRTGTPEGYNEDFLEMSPKFLENASFNNTIVLAFACSSADRSFASPSMMSTFIEKGASYYCGFSNTSNTIVVSQFGQKGAQLSFASLSLQDAFDYLLKNDLVVDINQNWIRYDRTYNDNVTQEKIDRYNLDLFDYEAKYDNCYLKSPFPYSLENHQNSHSVSLSWQSDLSEETLQFFTPDFEIEDFTYSEQTYKIRYDVYFNTELIASNLYDKEMMWDDMNENNTWYVVAKVVNSSTGETIATYKSEEEHFTISYHKLTLSTNSVNLSVNTSGSVDITSGSGSYVVESSDEHIATAFVDGNTISINALNPGEATITVSDKVSGQTATIMVTVTGMADTRELMVTKTVNKTVYSIYKKTLDENDYRVNPDGWRCYRSELILDIIKDGNTQSYVIDNNIYLDKQNNHHGGQQPCMVLDFNKNMIGIFSNSKDSKYDYTMDGYYYSTSMNNISFSKETVFEGSEWGNWGWFPYFRDYKDGSINLIHFSYAGYYTVRTTNKDGSWKHYYDNKDITPELAQQIWERIGSVLVIGNNQDEDVDDRISTVIPEELRDAMEDYIPIYDGKNPPNIEGSYFVDPEILIGSSRSYDQIGKKYSSEYQKYGNQDMTNNTIDMVRVQGGGSEWEKGSGAFISGTGNNFTIYFNMEGESSGIKNKRAYVISGTKTSTGIKNLTMGFIMTYKDADPDNKLVDVGTFRFFTDQDGMSEATSWPYGSQYGSKKRNVKGSKALPNTLDRCDAVLTPLK